MTAEQKFHIRFTKGLDTLDRCLECRDLIRIALDKVTECEENGNYEKALMYAREVERLKRHKQECEIELENILKMTS